MKVLTQDISCKTQAGKDVNAQLVVEGWHGIRDCAKMLGTKPPVAIWNIYTKLPVEDGQVVYTHKPEGKGWMRATIIEPLSELFKDEDTNVD